MAGIFNDKAEDKSDEFLKSDAFDKAEGTCTKSDDS